MSRLRQPARAESGPAAPPSAAPPVAATAAATGTATGRRGPLRRAGFARLWLAGTISETGDWLVLTGLPIFVLRLTGSALVTATVFIVELVPVLLLGTVAGVVADRFDRRRLLAGTAVVQAVALLPLVAVHGTDDLWIVYAVGATQAVLTALAEPARQALVPRLVEPGELVAANGLIGMCAHLGRLAGSPVGGLLAATGSLAWIALADAATFLLAAALVLSLPAPRAAAPGSGPPPGGAAPTGNAARAPAAEARPGRGRRGAGVRAFAREWAAGLAVLRRTAALRVLMLVTAISAVAQGVFVVLFVVFVDQVLHGGGGEIGFLRGVQAIGALAGGALVAAAGARLAPRVLAGTSLLAIGAISLAVWHAPALTTATPFYAAMFVLAGVPAVGFLAGAGAMVQTETPAEFLGRTFAAFLTVFNAGQVLGMLAAGLLGEVLDVVPVLTGQAVLYLLAGTVAVALLRRAGPAGS